MKKLAFIFGILVATLIATPEAFAGFYIEPGLTYEKGDNSIQWPAPFSESSGESKGLGLNVKLGYHADDVFFVGFDGSYSQPKFENSSVNYSADATSTTYGAIVGVQMPIVGLRLWGGYIFAGELNPKADGNFDVKFSSAKGPKLGVGFKVLMVSLNFEYMDLEYDKADAELAGALSGELTDNLKNKVGVVSVSLPFTL